MENTDVIVLGGGAAGLMCAITAGGRGYSVIVLEGSNRIGKKILMSGGGRCNFTNLHTDPTNFVSANRHFCKSALSRYTQRDFISLVEKHNIPYHEKTLGQLFCDKSSKDIVAMMQHECAAAGVNVLTDCGDIHVSKNGRFTVSCDHGKFDCNALVVATGGLSIPKMGASDFGYRLARQFGLSVLETRAGLVPFTFTGKILELCNRLSGVSCRATITVGNAVFAAEILFTHRGLSGPAVLQASSYWSPGDTVQIDLLPDTDAAAMLLRAKQSRPKSLLRVVLADSLPRALVVELQTLIWPRHKDTPLAGFSDDELRRIAGDLQSWTIKPAAPEGFRTAEGTLGGVDTRELSSKTMECRQHAGLYFIGEVVDVTGDLGGFNFQWAWASGYIAGQAV